MCPFCYIGKRKFEAALDQFPNKDYVEIIWKSFSLYPHLETNTETNIYDFLSQYKGMPLEHTKTMVKRVSDFAKSVGLDFDFDNAVIAKTTKAHQLIHLAHTQKLQDEMKERLLSAYFLEGKNVDDTPTLIQLGTEVGLTKEDLKHTLDNHLFLKEVQEDIMESRELGIHGVPYFVFNRKYGISGAQDESKFLETLHQSFNEWETENGKGLIEVIKGKDTCDIDGNC